MRALRERPRLAAAKLTGALAALIAAALVAAAIAGGDHDAPPDLRPRLERGGQLRDEQASELRQLDAEVARLRADLRAATRRARGGARSSERLRRRLLTVRRGLARERQR